MVCLVVTAHGHLAEDLVASSSIIVGLSGDVVVVTFDSSEDLDDLLVKYTTAVEAPSSWEYLTLVDLSGSDPYNVATRFTAGHDDVDVATSANLPMVIEVLSRHPTGIGLTKLVEATRTPIVGGVKALPEVFTPVPTATSDDEEDEL